MKAPLAEQLRPQELDAIVGQDHLLADDGLLKQSIRNQHPLSILLWGPPGCGKTTLARAYAKAFDARFVSLSAVFSGIADLKKIVKDAQNQTLFERRTVLFVDEIHRFNKAQQDGFLPYLEDGTLILVGATTENPSFALNNALLSRMRVLTLNALDASALGVLLSRYEEKYAALPIDDEGRAYLLGLAHGDGRYLLNLVENLQGAEKGLSLDDLKALLQRRSALFDRSGDGHYNLISALHKSIRGSDPDATLYWLHRMLESGEDPLFLARRLIRMASEDVGLADPQALPQAIAARDAYEMLGSPEGELALAQCAVYLALAPKSNAVYMASKAAAQLAKDTGHLSPPAIILNAPTKLMKDAGYGKGYQYDHDTEHGFSGQNYFPDDLQRVQFYQPVQRGFERDLQRRIAFFAELRKKQ